MTPLTTKAAEVRAGLADRLCEHVQSRGGLSRDAETGEIVLPNGAWAMMLEAADLIKQQAAELADLTSRLQEKHREVADLQQGPLFKLKEGLLARATTAESERDELLREKERLGALEAALSGMVRHAHETRGKAVEDAYAAARAALPRGPAALAPLGEE